MIDMEKVIKGLELCIADMNRSDSMPCRSCPYGALPKSENCQKRLFNDALALLKEQEAVAPYPVHNSFRWFACGKCDCSITREDRFCPRCGRAVKWE